ncbi:peroxiredoxin [Flavobacterium sp.]|uniref:peroxiredoxin n=1 Tax=Flavobacterium sp. TaxID=239 RepID=UPI003C65247F
MGLKVGDKIPFFTAKDSRGDDFDSHFLIGHKPVVIYFYPKDDTPGCTTQACGFRDQYQDFKEVGAEVIGISSDGLESHQRFSSKYKLPFLLLSDENKKIRNLFGVPSRIFGLLPGRVTYVADKNGVIQMVFNGIFAAKHIPKALEVVKQLIS